MRISMQQLRRIIREEATRGQIRLPLREIRRVAVDVKVGETSTHTLERAATYARGVEVGFIDPDYWTQDDQDDAGKDAIAYVITRKKPRGDDNDTIVFHPSDGRVETLSASVPDDEIMRLIDPLIAKATQDHRKLR